MTTLKNPIKRLKAHWYIWFFPVIALAISAYFMYDYFSERGPLIHIAFEDAGGVQVDKTTLRFRGVTFGTVRAVSVSDNHKEVIVSVELSKEGQSFAVKGSRFALVTPRVGFSGVSGLDALLEGVYIEVLPGPETAAAKFDFKGQPPQTTDPLDNTTPYLLETGDVESIKVGDGVTFRGLRVGSVSKLILTKKGRAVDVQVNIENHYVHLVRVNSAFWRKAGIDAKLGLFHSEVKVNSLDTIVNGGIAFATPDPAGPIAKAGEKFGLATSPPKEMAKWKPDLE